MSDYPRTADEFMRLPVGERMDDGVVFYMPDDLVVSVTSEDGAWLLQRRPSGEWFRVRRT